MQPTGNASGRILDGVQSMFKQNKKTEVLSLFFFGARDLIVWKPLTPAKHSKTFK